jgi:hypothetical protein
VFAAVADLARSEPIVGAFIAGLALNRLVPDSGSLMLRIEYVGSSLGCCEDGPMLLAAAPLTGYRAISSAT